MENLVEGSQSELPKQKPPPKRTGLSKEGTIPLRPIASAGSKNQERQNFFYYQRGKTKIECEGSPEKAIRLALVDTVCRWLIRLLIVIASVFSVQTTVKKIYENKKAPALKVPAMEGRKLR
jgi:hypothetical protein